jgi:predicted DNA-binding transcriptional regulator AlpA
MRSVKHAAIVAAFDTYPNAARVPVQVVSDLYGRSRASIWRDVKAGRIPAPVHIGRSARWVVGELRKSLAEGV